MDWRLPVGPQNVQCVMMNPREILDKYYRAFNAGDRDTMLALLDDNVVHEINQGDAEIGRQAFRTFMERMDACYHETLDDLVILTGESPDRAAAEFTVVGKYLATDEGFPPADGQTYRLPAGAFFSFSNGRISRITMYYNVKDWLRQIEA